MGLNIEITKIACATCEMVFCVPETFYIRRKEDGGAFHCPAGHLNTFAPSEVQRLRETLGRKEAEIKQINDKRQADALRLLEAERENERLAVKLVRASKKAKAKAKPVQPAKRKRGRPKHAAAKGV